MYKILILGFGSIGYRYFEAISKIKSPKIKIIIVDKKIKSLLKKYNLRNKFITTYSDIENISKKIDLGIISTTCNNRHILLKNLKKKCDFKSLIIEKPLTQSPNELLKLNNTLNDTKKVWVNTDRRSISAYKAIKSKINLKKKIYMKVEGNSWGICCNGLHFIDLFNFFCEEYIDTILEKKVLRWCPSKRKNFQELDNGELKLKFDKHELYLSSKKNSLPKNLKIFIKNGENKFYIKEKNETINVKYKNKMLFYENKLHSVKFINIIKKIILKNKSDLPNYENSSKIYFPLIQFFYKKWKLKFPKSKKVPIT